MNKLEHKEFERYLQGDSDLSQAYSRMESEDVPTALDISILNKSKPVQASKINSKKWFLISRLDSPLALAAVLVLCVSLVLVVSVNEQGLEDEQIHSDAPLSAAPVASKQKIRQSNTTADFEDISLQAQAPAKYKSVLADAEIVNSSLFKKENIETRRLVKPAPSSAPVLGAVSTMVQEAEADITADVLPLEAKAELAELVEKVVVSPDVSAKNIKILIDQNQLEQAKVEFQLFVSDFPEQKISDWFSKQEIALLDQ